MDPRKLLGLASLGFPVAGANNSKLSDYLHKFEAENHANLPCALTSSHLGWQGEEGKAGFLWGRTMIGPDGNDTSTIQFRAYAEGDEQIAAGYQSAGTYEAWRDGIKDIKLHPRVLVIFYAAFVPVLLRLLHAPNFVLDVCGATTAGKTTSLRVAASVWGCPEEHRPDAVIHTWDVTQVWAERASATISGIPLILDESKRVQNPQFIQDFIYMVVSGQGRARGNVESLARTRTWNTVLLSSGEAPAVSYSEAGGTRTRCLELRGIPFGAQNEATGTLTRQLNQALCSNYGHAGPRFVRHLLKHRHRWESYRQQYLAEISRYRDLAPACPEADRLAQAYAAIATAVPLVHEALYLAWDVPVGLPALNEIWPDIIGEAQDAVGAKRALREVVEWAHANESTFHERVPGVILATPRAWSGLWEGKSDWPFIAFFQIVLRKVLSDLNFEPEAILYEWKTRGWLDTRKDRKTSYTKQVSCNGSKPHMVVILRKSIDEVEAAS
jgi:putative DNA primase/helicase